MTAAEIQDALERAQREGREAIVVDVHDCASRGVVASLDQYTLTFLLFGDKRPFMIPLERIDHVRVLDRASSSALARLSALRGEARR